jgi:uncharacterized protein (DUF1330 family)
MSAYIVVQIDVEDLETFERYKQLAPPSIAEYGGRYIVRARATETLEGSWSPSRFVVFEFPTADAARAWWSSESYADAKAMRQRSASTQMILVEGGQIP